jgi:hypothetical protein
MDPRISLIRFYALCLAALACAVLWPDVGVGLWPVLFFFPSCTCCGFECGASTPACTTGSTPATITADISGVTGTCSNGTPCSALDGIYVLDWIVDIGSGCRYEFDLVPNVCLVGSGQMNIVSGFIQVVGGQTIIRILVPFTGGTIEWQSANQGAAAVDCATIGTVSCPPSFDNHVNCDNFSSTCNATV